MTHPQTTNDLIMYLRDMEDVLTDSFDNTTFRNEVITEQEEHLLLEQPYDPQCHSSTLCPILQSPFELNELVTVLPCNHVFNREAIRTWLKEHSSLCPLCRYNLKPVTHTTEQVEDEMPPLILDMPVDMPVDIFIHDSPIHVEPSYISFLSTERNENDFTVYYNIYYRHNTLLPNQD